VLVPVVTLGSYDLVPAALSLHYSVTSNCVMIQTLLREVESMRLRAILKLQCPHCLKGKVFRAVWKMYEICPNCGVRYEREEGYFMMAIFVGYVMGFFIAVPVLVVLYLTIRPSILGYVIGTLITLVLAAPLIFHYARVIWMHIDDQLDPRRPEELNKS
jgi:uncharacterized protein (DUF983 family)